jgi:hypothetical protein
MSDLTYTIQVNVDKGVFNQSYIAAGKTTEMATTGVLAVTLRCGTATQAISTASASSLGYCFARNLAEDTSGTAVVTFGRISGTSYFDAVRLKPGDAAFLRLAPGNYAAKGVAGSPTLLVEILED